jgi:hypothetical protein
MGRDFKDIKTIMKCILDHNPFSVCSRDLWKIFIGITDSANKVHVDDAGYKKKHSR